MQRYVVLNKQVGQTPLSCMEAWRDTAGVTRDIPLTYAGRLDPLASGKLLVLIGNECKHKEQYLGLDKAYDFSILFGVGSDSGDVLGIPTPHDTTTVSSRSIKKSLHQLPSTITLPYPVFSAKPVNGVPLHTWAAEGRLDEIEIPTTTTAIHKLNLLHIEQLDRDTVYTKASTKIDSIPPVTELRKALGNDFRRDAIRQSWLDWKNQIPAEQVFTVAHCRVVCASGTYVRSLATHIGTLLGTKALALSIHRTHIGTYYSLPAGLGFWWPQY